MAESGEHEADDCGCGMGDACQSDGTTPPVLVGDDEHPHWCRCQRVCGGDQ